MDILQLQILQLQWCRLNWLQRRHSSSILSHCSSCSLAWQLLYKPDIQKCITSAGVIVNFFRFRFRLHLFQPHQADQMSGCHWTSQLHKKHLV